MSSSAKSSASASGPKVLYRERLYVPIWWWIGLLGIIALVVGQGAMMGTPWWLWLLIAVIAPLLVWLMYRTGQERISVTEDAAGNRTLHASGANLPFEVISRCTVVPATAKSAAMGRQLDPEAYVVHRGFVPTMAIVVLDDPADPTPYWLLSTRRPDELTDLLPGKQ